MVGPHQLESQTEIDSSRKSTIHGQTNQDENVVKNQTGTEKVLRHAGVVPVKIVLQPHLSQQRTDQREEHGV